MSGNVTIYRWSQTTNTRTCVAEGGAKVAEWVGLAAAHGCTGLSVGGDKYEVSGPTAAMASWWAGCQGWQTSTVLDMWNAEANRHGTTKPSQTTTATTVAAKPVHSATATADQSKRNAELAASYWRQRQK